MSTFSYDDIARYADGEMQAGERLSFEEALSVDLSLQQRLDLYREVHASLQQHFGKDEQQEHLQQSLQEMRKEFFPVSSKPAKVVSFKRYLRSLTAVAAILVAVLFIWEPWRTDLFEDYATTQMVAPVERGENSETLLQNAAIAFNKEDFSTAARILQTVIQQQPGNSFAQFYYGVALLQTNQLAEARVIFDRLFQGASVFKYEAAFYQALTYLKEDNQQACREWLQKIPTDAGNYEKAQSLLNKL
jgi:cytochrome c-type biogenesis protein CcmH/NrfG